jgi:hypothetical protein
VGGELLTLVSLSSFFFFAISNEGESVLTCVPEVTVGTKDIFKQF